MAISTIASNPFQDVSLERYRGGRHHGHGHIPTHHPGQYPGSTTPGTGNSTTPPATPGSGLGTDSFSSISSMLATGAGGGFASFKLSGEMADNFKNFSGNGAINGLKSVGLTGLKGAGLSALVSAGVSAISNGIGVATGKTDSSKAVSNVVGDTITGAVGGLGAVTLGGLGTLALGKMGVAGIPLTIAAVALGAVGGVAASVIKDKIINK